MEWIDAHETLPDPKKHKNVLIFEFLENIHTKKSKPHIWIEEANDLYEWEGYICSETGAENITHWMPLPEPPKELDGMD